MRITCLLTAVVALFVLACAPAYTTNYATPAPAQSSTPPTATTPQLVPEGAKEILAEGAAAIIGGDKGIARDHALSDARRKAVEQGVGSVINSETVVKNFQLISDNIYSKATGYVSSYKVLSEESDADLYRVTIRAVVKVNNIKDDLGAIGLLIEGQGRPRTIILIRDVRPGTDDVDTELASDLETMVIDHFTVKSFPVVDAEMVKRNLSADQVKLILNGDNKTAALLGEKLGAEIVLAGKADAGQSEKTLPYSGSGAQTFYSTKLNCRVVNVATAEILAAQLVTRDLPYSRDASRKEAAQEAAEGLMAKVIKGWQSRDIVTQVYCLNADNTKLSKLKSEMSMLLRGVNKVLLRDFTGSYGVLEVLATTSSQEVYDRLSAAGWSVPFSIKGFSGNRIDLEFTVEGGNK